MILSVILGGGVSAMSSNSSPSFSGVVPFFSISAYTSFNSSAISSSGFFSGLLNSSFSVPILMATIYTESNFEPRARPPRTKLFGVIPWKRPSTAYGYSQALDGTWERYQRETGRFAARRTNFGDAIHFVGWYHATSNRTNGIAKTDAYNLYLAYYSGHAGYSRGSWRGNAGVQRAAQRATTMANRYAGQLQGC